MQAAFSALAPESQDDAGRSASPVTEFRVTGKKTANFAESNRFLRKSVSKRAQIQ
jgi:hypothetical protein